MSEPGTDVLAIGAHPDDVELNTGGLLLRARNEGRRTAICHLTGGEMGTRGTPAARREEAAAAARALGAAAMEILGLPDGRVNAGDAAKDVVIRAIRRHRPRLVLAPHYRDLHPDHEATGEIVRKAAFLSGLAKWDTDQAPWRPERVLYYMSHTPVEPDILVDISDVLDEKKSAARSYRSQFFDPCSEEPTTFIAGPDFWHWWEGRAAYWGHFIGVAYAEPYHVDGPIPTRSPFDLFGGFGKYKNS